MVFDKLKKTYLSVTNACNLRCIHCFKSSGKPYPNEITLDDIINLFDDIKKNKISNQVAITGGEPFLRTDLEEIFKAAHEREINIDISTNATLLNKKNIEILEKYDNICYLQVSIDGARRESYEKMRGQNSFKLLLNGLKKIKNSGLSERLIDINMITIVTPFNLDDIPKLATLAEIFGLSKIVLGETMPFGRGLKNYEKLELKLNHLKRIYELIEIAKKRTSVTIISKLYFGAVVNNKETPSICTAADDIIGIGPDGSVVPCPYCSEKEFSIGNIKTQNYSTILKSKKLEMFRDIKHRRKIKYKDYPKCNGGCFLVSKTQLNDYMSCDPRCPIKWKCDLNSKKR